MLPTLGLHRLLLLPWLLLLLPWLLLLRLLLLLPCLLGKRLRSLLYGSRLLLRLARVPERFANRGNRFGQCRRLFGSG